MEDESMKVEDEDRTGGAKWYTVTRAKEGGRQGGDCVQERDGWVAIGNLEFCFPRLGKRKGQDYAEVLDDVLCAIKWGGLTSEWSGVVSRKLTTEIRITRDSSAFYCPFDLPEDGSGRWYLVRSPELLERSECA